MTHIGRTMMLGLFVTLSTDNCMVSHKIILDKIWELSVISNTSVLLATTTCNMVRWVTVVLKIDLKVLM